MQLLYYTCFCEDHVVITHVDKNIHQFALRPVFSDNTSRQGIPPRNPFVTLS